MDISGLIQRYDSRSASSSPMNRGILAPQYNTHQSYNAAASSHLVGQQQEQQSVQHNPFSYNPYPGGNVNVIVPAPAFANYIQPQPQPLPRLMQSQNEVNRRIPYIRNDHHQGFVEEMHSQSPPIKNEPLWNTPHSSPVFVASKIKSKTITSTAPTNGSSEVTFGTEVDTLMKAIQAKSHSNQPQQSSTMNLSRPVVGASPTPTCMPSCSQVEVQAFGQRIDFKLTHEDLQDDTRRLKDDKKKYHCTIENCPKSFYQKTHLDIHERAHTGDKPYHCNEVNCDRSFSQQGNLKTHQRRHTGERPYQCETCGKRFAQRGNVRAHRIVHDQVKPYICRLDSCGKQFTQLGNLKHHQNKFHAPTIRDLTSKFASIKDGDIVNAADKELWEYFANLYKNSNKGIKGRGKDRKVGPNPISVNGVRSLGIAGGPGYTMAGPGRGNMVVGLLDAGMSSNHGLKMESQYEMFDADDESQSGSSSGSGASSVATSFDDVPADGFEDTGRGSNLAFGDRIY